MKYFLLKHINSTTKVIGILIIESHYPVRVASFKSIYSCQVALKNGVVLRDDSLVGLPLFSERMQLRAIRNNSTYRAY